MLTLRPGQRVLQIPGYGVQTSRRAVSVAAAAGWWVVAGKTSVGAYLAKGAASYAASKVNLANPGTDLADGAAYPAWDATAGWTYTAASSQYLDTGITPNVNGNVWSFLVRFSGASGDRCVIGCTNTTDNGNMVIFSSLSGQVLYANGEYLFVAPGASSGVLAVAGNKAYRNGAVESGTLGAAGARTWRTMYIGARHTGSNDYYFNGSVQAAAIYSDTLTAGEVATVSAAMAAL